MIKRFIRGIFQSFGYDLFKVAPKDNKKYKVASDDPRFDYYNTPKGKFYLPKNCENDVVANAIKNAVLFDESIYDIAKSYIKKDTILLDIGSNFGQMAIEIAKNYPEVDVYGFDAQKLVFDVLQKNIHANKLKNVKVHFNAVYNENGKVFLFPVSDLQRFPTYGSYGLDLNATEGIAVESLTIDSLNFEKPICFMKIDIQGSDLAALQGARQTIAKNQMPIIFEYEEQFQNEFNTSFQDYVEFVESINYRFLKTVDLINYLIVPK